MMYWGWNEFFVGPVGWVAGGKKWSQQTRLLTIPHDGKIYSHPKMGLLKIDPPENVPMSRKKGTIFTRKIPQKKSHQFCAGAITPLNSGVIGTWSWSLFPQRSFGSSRSRARWGGGALAARVEFLKILKSTPPKINGWNLEMMVSNRNLLFQGSIFRFHVCFGGCIIFPVPCASSEADGSNFHEGLVVGTLRSGKKNINFLSPSLNTTMDL